jgi:hypothetical protein
VPALVELRQTCPACPAQWEAKTDDGRFVYVRFRHGSSALGSQTSVDDAVDHDAVISAETGDRGVMALPEMLERTGFTLMATYPPAQPGADDPGAGSASG